MQLARILCSIHFYTCCSNYQNPPHQCHHPSPALPQQRLPAKHSRHLTIFSLTPQPIMHPAALSCNTPCTPHPTQLPPLRPPSQPSATLPAQIKKLPPDAETPVLLALLASIPPSHGMATLGRHLLTGCLSSPQLGSLDALLAAARTWLNGPLDGEEVQWEDAELAHGLVNFTGGCVVSVVCAGSLAALTDVEWVGRLSGWVLCTCGGVAVQCGEVAS
jgi:hypothetical protein